MVFRDVYSNFFNVKKIVNPLCIVTMWLLLYGSFMTSFSLTVGHINVLLLVTQILCQYMHVVSFFFKKRKRQGDSLLYFY